MQISRRILVACVTTTMFLPTFLKADTEAQIKARQALEQKMNELGAQQGIQPPVAPAPATRPAPAARPAQPAPAPVIVTPQPAPAPASNFADSTSTPTSEASSESQEKALQALRQKMSELQQQPAAATPPSESMPKPVAATPGRYFDPAHQTNASDAQNEKALEALRQKMNELQQQPVAANPQLENKSTGTAAMTSPNFQPVPQTSSGPENEKALEALRQKMNALPQQPVATAPKPEEKAKKQPQKSEVVNAKNAGPFQPMQGPATGLSPAKEQRLQQLLQDYRADKLSPDEYHTQRAKILAEP